jgi:hypothetical protein
VDRRHVSAQIVEILEILVDFVVPSKNRLVSSALSGNAVQAMATLPPPRVVAVTVDDVFAVLKYFAQGTPQRDAPEVRSV